MTLTGGGANSGGGRPVDSDTGGVRPGDSGTGGAAPGDSLATDGGANSGGDRAVDSVTGAVRPVDSATGGVRPGDSGTGAAAPGDEATGQRATGGSTVTLLAFLTTTCAPCQPFWEMLASSSTERDLGARLVVVTPSRSMENERLARQLTPLHVPLHMGSATWFAYGVGQAGTFVLVRSGIGDAPPWEQPGDVLGSARPHDPSKLPDLIGRWLERAATPRQGGVVVAR